jgi:energy-coupling factor transporter ATP-binding protein EcfA2
MVQNARRPPLRRRSASTPADVTTFGRKDFLDHVWDYKAGQHVTFCGRTQSGKTTLAFQLLARIPEHIVPIVLVMKPRDPTVVRWTNTLGFKRTTVWPPLRSSKRMPRNYKPPGWVVWPNLGNIDTDDATTRALFQKVMADSYSQAAKRNPEDRVIFADEVVGIANELGLKQNLAAIWMRGSGMGLGLWAGAQRPFELPQNALTQSVHLFLHRDDDKRNRERFAEIGGVDPDFVMEITSSMREHQFLYIARLGYYMAIVDVR